MLDNARKAIFYYEQSLKIIFNLSKSFEETHSKPPQTLSMLNELKAQVYNNLGITYNSLNKSDKAFKLFTESCKIKSDIYGSTSPEALEATHNMAILLDNQNYHTNAMAIYDSIIASYKLTKDLDNLIYADCLQNKAISLYNINDYTSALSLLNEAVTIKKKKTHKSVSLAITL